MITLVKTDDAVPIVGIYKKKEKKPTQTVYFTHETKKDNQNHADAKGVLHLHRNELKKEFRINNADFDELCRMIDAEEEPEMGDPGDWVPRSVRRKRFPTERLSQETF